MKKYLFLTLIFVGILIVPTVGLAVVAPGTPGTTPGTIASNIKNAVLSVAAAVVVIGWVISGILFLTAAGAPDKLSIAKKALIASVAGTIIIVLAATIGTMIATLVGGTMPT